VLVERDDKTGLSIDVRPAAGEEGRAPIYVPTGPTVVTPPPARDSIATPLPAPEDPVVEAGEDEAIETIDTETIDEAEGKTSRPAGEGKTGHGVASTPPGLSGAALRSSSVTEPAATGQVGGSDGRGVSTFRPLPRVIAVANQKGGVGKTTTTVNLGAALAELGYRVLVVDLDPQGNATTGLGIDARNLEHSMYDVLMHDTPMEDCIEPTSVRRLFVAPATIDLAGVEIELVPAFSRELRLRRAVESVVEDFDFVLIDCPPSLGLITVNGLAAAGEVLVPIQCEYYALEGLGQLLRNVHLVASNLNDGLEVSAIVLTMYDARTRLAVDVVSEVREHFGDKVCRIVIPRTIRLSEAPSFGQPITVFDPSSRGAVAYRELAKEVSNGAAQRTG
jgi:chromosome partitioning protein